MEFDSYTPEPEPAPEAPARRAWLPWAVALLVIVVGVATTAVGLALIVRINRAYSTIEDDEIRRADHPDPS